MIKRERELMFKLEAGEAARRASILADSRIAELETQLQQCMAEKESLQFRLDDSAHSQGQLLGAF